MKLITLALFIASLFLLTSCTHREDTKYNNYIHEYVESNVKGFDPVVSGDLYSAKIMSQVFECLLQYNYLDRPIHTEPLLAEAMPAVSKDGLTYTFKIKKGVHFHDSPAFKDNGGKGREVVADDFIYEWKRMLDPKNKSDGAWVFEGKVKGYSEWRDAAVKAGSADYTKPIEGFETPDQHTIVIKLIKPYPQLLYVLTMVQTSAIPHEAVEYFGPDFQNHPLGSGPYVFKSWVHNGEIILDKNPNYRDDFYPTKGEASDQANGFLADAGKKLPLNDGIVFTEMVEEQPRWLNFLKGNFDWISIPKDNFDNSIKDGQLIDEYKGKGINLSKWVDMDVTFDAFNMDDPLVGKNKYLRQAMSMAYNTEELIKKFYNGRAIAAVGPIPPDVIGWEPDRKNPYRGYDLAKAKELLKKAGFPEGKNLPEINYETYSGSNARQIVEFFQQQMSQIGIKIHISMNTWPEFLEKIKARKAQILGMAWNADYPDGENFLQLFYGPNASPGPNNSNYNNPAYNKLYEQASIMSDTPERMKIYDKMQDTIAEDCPWIFDIHRRRFILEAGWFKNYKRSETISNSLKYYRIDQQAKADLKKKL